jgi:nucleotide-binding universal stress UspA family protein
MTIKSILLIADHAETATAGLQWSRALAVQLIAHLQVAWIGIKGEPPIAAGDLKAGTVSVLHQPTLDEAWLARLARHTDLGVIALPRAGSAARDEDMRLFERLTREVGCPLVVLPPRLVAKRIARRVAIAWNAAAPAQRAMRAALPLLAKADAVAIVTVHPDSPLDIGGRLGRFLERHNIEATLEPIIGEERDAGALLAQAVDQLDVDLLVMGAWSRPPLAERLFGGATRHLLGELGVPVLISA